MPFFLFSLRRRTRSPFSSKKFFVLLAQVSSAAILFAENRYTEQFFVFFFFTEKIFNEKNIFFLRIFFLKLENQVQKFPGKNCGFPQKCGRLEALCNEIKDSIIALQKNGENALLIFL